MSRPQRSMGVCTAVALVAMSAAPGWVHAQSVSELANAGRFEEAAALLSSVGPEEADQGASLIFDEAYQNGFQRQDFAYCIRGVAAAKEIPNLSEQQRQLLDFWHGFTVFQLAMPLASPQDLASARRTLPMFQEAAALIRASGDYYPNRASGPSIYMSFETLLEGLGTYTDIQEAIIRRGY